MQRKPVLKPLDSNTISSPGQPLAATPSPSNLRLIMSAPAAPTAPPVPTWEDRLPEVQRKTNRFCENWIFAFIIAMGIRHFVVEPFRIPTASMEPTLYGDPALNRSDFVVVDKISSRFRAVQRFDVTVFQFPHPEIAGPGGAPISALDEVGKRHDNWLTQPLVYRNFVKRAVVLPGDRFYFANGDLFLAGKDGTFAVAKKPAAVQEAVWERIYSNGAQAKPEWYLPWNASGGASIDNKQDQGLVLNVTPTGAVTFTQPFTNLYFKPGLIRVERKFASKGPEQVEIALDKPEFTVQGVTGSAWDTDQWWLQRLTTADLDNPGHGALLNGAMHERIGDVRVTFAVTALTGLVSCVLNEGSVHQLSLQLSDQAWRLLRTTATGGDEILATGAGASVGRTFALANIDDEVVVTIDGSEVHRSAIAAADPQTDVLAWRWVGDGSITVQNLHAERDLHYCANGFLAPEKLYVQPNPGSNSSGEVGTRDRLPALIRMMASAQGGQREQVAKELRHERDVRAQMAGHPITDSELPKRLGFSPETAITAPDNAYLLMGDNSPMSWDSRNWGFVPAANLRGRVVLRIRSVRFGDWPYIPFLDWSLVH